MMRTKLIFRTGSGAVADYLAEKLIGSSDWERNDFSKSFGSNTSRTASIRNERELVVMPNWFEEQLGAVRSGVKTCWVGPQDVCVLVVPYPTWKPIRKATVAARWVNDNNFRLRGGPKPLDAGIPPGWPTAKPGVAGGQIPPIPGAFGASAGAGLFGVNTVAQMLARVSGVAGVSPGAGGGPSAADDEEDDE